MKKLIAFIASFMLLPSALAHDTGKAHPFHNTYTVLSVNGPTIVLNGASVPAAYTAALGDKTVIEINTAQFQRKSIIGRGATLPCVNAWVAANVPVGKEVVPMTDNWNGEVTAFGPKYWGDVVIDGKSVRAELLAAQASCTLK